MLFGAITVLIAVAGAESDEMVRALEHALRTTLSADATVIVRPVEPNEDPEAIRAKAASEHAILVGIVSTEGPQRTVVRFARPNEAWILREIHFEPSDAPRERGRTIGFALASVIPDEAPPAPAAPPTSPVASGPAPGPSIDAAEAAPKSLRFSPGRSLWLDLFGMMAAGLDGYGGGGGGGVAVRVRLLGDLRARFALAARGGEIAPAQASSRTYFGSLGLSWQPWLDDDRHLGLGARADFVTIGTEIAHFDADDPEPARRFRVVPGADVAAEGVWRFTESAAFVGSLGTEIAFGSTTLYVRNARVAAIAPARALAELGVRVIF